MRPMRPTVWTVVLIAALAAGACKQGDGAMPAKSGDIPNRLGDLKREFARRGDHQCERQAGGGERAVGQQLVGHGEAEGDGLARAGLGGDEQVAALGIVLRDGGLDGGEIGIAARGQRLGEAGGQVGEGHGPRNMARGR